MYSLVAIHKSIMLSYIQHKKGREANKCMKGRCSSTKPPNLEMTLYSIASFSHKEITSFNVILVMISELRIEMQVIKVDVYLTDYKTPGYSGGSPLSLTSKFTIV